MKRMTLFFVALVLQFVISISSGCLAEDLNESEKLLVDTLIKMATSDFYDPSSVRVLEIGDYMDCTSFKDTSPEAYGPETVIVKLQGQNRVGGTVNNYYLICLTGATNTKKADVIAQTKKHINAGKMLGADVSDSEIFLFRFYEAETGDYMMLPSSYSLLRQGSYKFNVKNINLALKAHWEDLGL